MKKTASIKLRRIFGRAIAAVLTVAFCATVVFSAWRFTDAKGEAVFAWSPVVSDDYTRQPGARRTAFTSTNTRLRLEGTSAELDLGISVLQENGQLVSGYLFVFTVTSIKNPTNVMTINDDKKTGQVYIADIAEGDYEIALINADGLESPGPITVTVEPKVVYQRVDVSDKVKTSDQVNESGEDAKFGGGTNNNGGTPAPPVTGDTVEYVESTKTAVGTREVEKPVLDGAGNQVYKYKPQLSSGGFLLTANGTETDITPVLDADGYITGAKRGGVDCTGEVLDGSGVPVMESGAYKYRFEQVGLTQKVTETIYRYTGWQNIDGKVYYYTKDGNFVTGWQKIQGVEYFFSADGVRGGKIGIDVSTWQGSIDWKKVKAAGVEFAFIRLGYRGYGSGTLVLDDWFERNIKGATAAGVKVGVYFFTQAINEREAVEEASMCLQYVKGYNLAYPIAIDIEDAGSASARTNSLTTEQRTKICIAFCETIRNAGYSAAVYANKYYFTSMLNTPQLEKYIIWLAHYTTATNYNRRYDIWQHSSTGRVDGISGNVDMNISYLNR